MTPELNVVTDPTFTAGLGERDMDELRAMRARCQSLENSLSYVRRLIQGRLDIAGGEVQRRSDGGTSGDTSDLIGRLPEILSEGSRTDAGPGQVRPPQSMDPDPNVTRQLEALLDATVSPEDLGRATGMSDVDLRSAVDGLNLLEDDVSSSRRMIHNVIDTLQAEVKARYKAGEASVEGLLQN